MKTLNINFEEKWNFYTKKNENENLNESINLARLNDILNDIDFNNLNNLEYDENDYSDDYSDEFDNDEDNDDSYDSDEDYE